MSVIFCTLILNSTAANCYRFVNSLASGMCNFRGVFFKLVLRIDIVSYSCKSDHRWVPLDPIDHKWTFVLVKAWFPQATNHYLSQYRPRTISRYGAIEPQWVKSLWLYDLGYKTCSTCESRVTPCIDDHNHQWLYDSCLTSGCIVIACGASLGFTPMGSFCES